MKKILSALMLCLVSIVLTSCGKSTNSAQKVNVSAGQADAWQSIGSVTCYIDSPTPSRCIAQLYVKNVYGVNYYKVKIYGSEYGVEDNPDFEDFELGPGMNQRNYKNFKHVAGDYYLNLPGEMFQEN